MNTRLLAVSFALNLLGLLTFGGAADAKIEVAVNQIEFAGFPLLRAYVTVTKAGGPLLGLTPAAFSARENGAPVTDLHIESVRTLKTPIAVVLAIDRSGSMRGEAIRQAIGAASVFVKELADGDVVGLVTFDDKVARLAAPTGDRQQVLGKIAAITLGGDTALNDGVAAAVGVLAGLQAPRKAVIVLTDGKENRSRTSLEDAVAAAKSAGVPVHTVGLGAKIDRKALARLAQETGGLTFESSGPEGLVSLYQRIGTLLRNQYVVSFKSSTALDRAWHRVAIAVVAGEERAEGELGYLATLEAGANPQALRRFASQQGRKPHQAVLVGLGILIAGLAVAIAIGLRRRSSS